MSAFWTTLLVLILWFWLKPKGHKTKSAMWWVGCPWGYHSNRAYPLDFKVWHPGLILSCLSAFLTPADAHDTTDLREFQETLKNMATLFHSSDGSFYAPPYSANCSHKFLHCYLLELYVILYEENGKDEHRNLVYVLEKTYNSSYSDCLGCPSCEEQKIVDLLTFYKNLQDFLERLISDN